MERVFRSDSDGKVTHIRIVSYPTSSGRTAPLYNDISIPSYLLAHPQIACPKAADRTKFAGSLPMMCSHGGSSTLIIKTSILLLLSPSLIDNGSKPTLNIAKEEVCGASMT